jgi:D-glycero-D-manno-heptose 1,7-bisphosphate phosphatase
MAKEKAPAVFFDRDGTIMQDVDYCSDPKDVHVFLFVAESLRKLKARGYKLLMVTNQSGMGRGYFTWEQYQAVHAEVMRQIGEPLIDATYVCPDPPGVDSICRKPAPGMVLQGAREHNIDLGRSIFVGDKEIDVYCGHNAGIKAIRLQTGFEKNTADWVAEDLAEATEIILTKFGG